MADSTTPEPRAISAEQLKRLIDRDERFRLLDTRDRESFEGWRIAGASQLRFTPDHDFDVKAFRTATGLDTDDPIVTICGKGRSSRILAEKLVEHGFTHVSHVEGGMQAWSTVYDTVDVETDDSVEIVQLQRRAKGCLGYLVADSETGVAAAIDPTRHTEVFREAASARGYRLERVFDTHIHADHISGGRRLADDLDVPYTLGERVADRDLEVEFQPLGRNEVVELGGVEIKAVFTPGHTSGMANYLVDDTALLTGDTAFVDGVGRTELQFGDADAASGADLLYDSLHGTVLSEPDSITILPGHFAVSDAGEYGVQPGLEISTTVGALRTGLALLRRDRDAFVRHVVETAPEKPPNYERIISINRGKYEPGDADAIELELGPNRCAAE